MNVVLYMRYSSERQTEQSIEGQDRVCTEFCEKNGYTIIDRYIDRATSGFKNTEKRKAFAKMMQDSKDGLFEGIVVYRLDRFSRNRYESAMFRNDLKSNNVKLISATENISDSPEGVLMESVLEGFNEYYSLELAQKSMRGMRESAYKCQYNGGTIPLGYDIVDKHYVINEAEALLVRRIFEMSASGIGKKKMCKILNGEGIKNKNGRSWCVSSFNAILKNRRYLGEYRFDDIVIPNGIPKIIDETLFDTVQARAETFTHTAHGKDSEMQYILTGKLVCAKCGGNYVGSTGTSKTGKRVGYYVCHTRRKTHKCDAQNINKEVLENIVFDEVYNTFVKNKDAIIDKVVKLIEKGDKKNASLPILEKRLCDLTIQYNTYEKAFESIVAYGNEKVIKDYIQKMNDTSKDKEDIEKQIAKIKEVKPSVTKDMVIWWLDQVGSGDIDDIEFRSKLINLLVDKVIVDVKDKHTVHLTTTYLIGDNPTDNVLDTRKFAQNKLMLTIGSGRRMVFVSITLETVHHL